MHKLKYNAFISNSFFSWFYHLRFPFVSGYFCIGRSRQNRVAFHVSGKWWNKNGRVQYVEKNSTPNVEWRLIKRSPTKMRIVQQKRKRKLQQLVVHEKHTNKLTLQPKRKRKLRRLILAYAQYSICPDCNQSFSSKRGLSSHKRIHKKDETGPTAGILDTSLPCPFCSKSFQTQKDIIFHVETHIKEESQDQRVKGTRRPSPQNANIFDQDIKDKPIAKTKAYAISKDVKAEPECQTKPVPTKYPTADKQSSYCELCEKYFANSRGLASHWGKVHRGVDRSPKDEAADTGTRHECFYCDLQFGTDLDLGIHIGADHTDFQISGKRRWYFLYIYTHTSI